MRRHALILVLAWFGQSPVVGRAAPAEVGCQASRGATRAVLAVEHDEGTGTSLEVKTAGAAAMEVVGRAKGLSIDLTVCEEGRLRLKLGARQEWLTVDTGPSSVVVGRRGRAIILNRDTAASSRVAARALVDGSPLPPRLREVAVMSRDTVSPSLIGASLELARSILAGAVSGVTERARGRSAVRVPDLVRHAALKPAQCWDSYWAVLHLATVDLASCAAPAAGDFGCQLSWNREVSRAYYRLLECLLQ